VKAAFTGWGTGAVYFGLTVGVLGLLWSALSSRVAQATAAAKGAEEAASKTQRDVADMRPDIREALVRTDGVKRDLDRTTALLLTSPFRLGQLGRFEEPDRSSAVAERLRQAWLDHHPDIRDFLSSETDELPPDGIGRGDLDA
jgi:hypothetical protein